MHLPLHYSIMATRQKNRDSIACTVFNVGPAVVMISHVRSRRVGGQVLALCFSKPCFTIISRSPGLGSKSIRKVKFQ
jgi:hypothetical protein